MECALGRALSGVDGGAGLALGRFKITISWHFQIKKDYPPVISLKVAGLFVPGQGF